MLKNFTNLVVIQKSSDRRAKPSERWSLLRFFFPRIGHDGAPVKQLCIHVICRPGGPYWEKLRPRAWLLPIRAEQGGQITCLFSLYGIALKATFVFNFN